MRSLILRQGRLDSGILNIGLECVSSVKTRALFDVLRLIQGHQECGLNMGILRMGHKGNLLILGLHIVVSLWDMPHNGAL